MDHAAPQPAYSWCGRLEAVWMLSPVLLPLMASVLAPWSLSRMRHP
jgi:hypothetical protein